MGFKDGIRYLIDAALSNDYLIKDMISEDIVLIKSN
jgi:hypothetical protein